MNTEFLQGTDQVTTHLHQMSNVVSSVRVNGMRIYLRPGILLAPLLSPYAKHRPYIRSNYIGTVNNPSYILTLA